MRIVLALVLVGLTRPLSEAKDYPQGYWDRSYNSGGEVPAASYSLTIQVKDIGKAIAEADRRMSKAGGSLLSMSSSGPYDGTGRQMKSISYSVESQSAEKAAKGFFDLGEVQNYNSQKARGSHDLTEMRERMAALTAEKEGNAACLEKMDISSHLLNSRIAQLKQALSALEAGSARATIQLSLIELKAKPKS